MARGVALARKLKKEMKSHGKDYWMAAAPEEESPAGAAPDFSRKTSKFISHARLPSDGPPLIRGVNLCLLAIILSIPFICRDKPVNPNYDIPAVKYLTIYDDYYSSGITFVQLNPNHFYYGGQRLQPEFNIPL